MSHTVDAPTAVTLAEVLSAARRARLSGSSSHPRTVLDHLHRARPGLEQHEMYGAIVPHVTDPEEQRVLRWYCDARRLGQLVMTMGAEFKTLENMWRRLVTDAIPPISADEQSLHNREQLRRLHTGDFR